MKYIFIFMFFLITMKNVFAQPGEIRYRDSVFNAVEMLTVTYGSNINYAGEMDSLKADVYSPSNDSAADRAMIIYMHGGGFMNGHRNDPGVKDLCRKLTLHGYVTASIDYRLGMNALSPLNMIEPAVRAVQDLNGFIRFAKANAAEWKIDTSKIFITGSSAGAIAVLAKAFTKIDSISATLGINSQDDLEGKTNDLPFTSSVAGAFSMWGAVFDTSWIQKGDMPVGCVHSIGDSTVPFNVGYNRRNKSHLLYGSLAIYNRALSLGIPTALHGYESGQHDLGIKVAPYKDTTVQLISSFFYRLMHPETYHGSFLPEFEKPAGYYDNLDTKKYRSRKNRLMEFLNSRYAISKVFGKKQTQI